MTTKDTDPKDTLSYLLPEKTYLVLKWAGLIALPAIATFVGAVGIAAGIEQTAIAVVCLTAAGTLIGSLIGYSSAGGK